MGSTYNARVGDRVRVIREELDWSRRHCAEQIGISVSTLEHIERGRTDPRRHLPAMVRLVDIGARTDRSLTDLEELLEVPITIKSHQERKTL